MADRIGPFSFVRLDAPPQRVQPQWEVAGRAGVPGTACWDTGERGEPFSVGSEAVELTFLDGRQAIQDYLTLVSGPPVTLFYGTLEAAQKYKVLKVELLGVKRVLGAFIGGSPLIFTALVFARWTLLPIDPFVVKP